MTLESISNVRAEAERFLRILGTLEDRARAFGLEETVEITGIKELGNVRRASLDLTSMLADFRRKSSMEARRKETGHSSITEERRWAR